MLIVETGLGLANADSYVTLIDARALAVKFGMTLPTDDTQAEIALRNGCQYVELQEQQFSGERATWTQALSWPRSNAATSYGMDIASNAIPQQLIKAQVFAAVEYASGLDVRANDDGKSIASEEVTGAVAVSYFNSGKTGSSVTLTKVMDALKPLLVGRSTGFEFRVGRA